MRVFVELGLATLVKLPLGVRALLVVLVRLSLAGGDGFAAGAARAAAGAADDGVVVGATAADGVGAAAAGTPSETGTAAALSTSDQGSDGLRARTLIEAFMRKRLPNGSRDAYTSGELEAFRAAAPDFLPYGMPCPPNH